MRLSVYTKTGEHFKSEYSKCPVEEQNELEEVITRVFQGENGYVTLSPGGVGRVWVPLHNVSYISADEWRE